MNIIWLPVAISFPLVVIGIIWSTPEFRANFLIWRRKDSQARALLEQIVEQKPNKMQLYGKLARIYYLENRKDRKAIRFYELIVKFKLPFEWRDELYVIVAKHYIKEGRQDTEAIRIIERAVDKELKKFNGVNSKSEM